MSNPFGSSSSGSSLRRAREPAKWPLWVLWGLSAIGLIIALFANTVWSAFAYGVLVISGAILLYRFRTDRVAAARATNAAASVVGVRLDEKLTIIGLVIACVANGIVLGMWVGGWEIWF